MLKSSSDNRTIKETGFTGASVFLSVNVRGPVYFAVSAFSEPMLAWNTIGHLGINFSDILIEIISRVQPPILAIAHIAQFGDQM